jgi:hypothetical protein
MKRSLLMDAERVTHGSITPDFVKPTPRKTTGRQKNYAQPLPEYPAARHVEVEAEQTGRTNARAIKKHPT